MSEEVVQSSKQSHLVLRTFAGLVDCLIVAGIDCALMYIVWLLGMAAGALDSHLDHWMELLMSVPLFFADGATVLLLPASIVYLNMNQAWDSSSTGLANLWLICCCLANWLYHVLFECSAYRGTLGKQLFGLSIVDAKGETLDFGTSSLRHFARILYTLTIGAGYLPLWGKNRNRALQDVISRTRIVKE